MVRLQNIGGRVKTTTSESR